METEIVFLGTRGTVPTDNKKHLVFGGATLSTLIKTKNCNIVLDAGSGFLNINDYIEYDKDEKVVLHILISHTHFDHIMGLVASDIMFNQNATINIYGKRREKLSVKEQINCFMSPPVWPVDSSSFKATVNFHDIEDEFFIENISVDFIDGVHPGGSTIYKLDIDGKKIVYATDTKFNKDEGFEFTQFVKGANILIADGQYSSADMVTKFDYGHSYWRDTVMIAKKCGCELLTITHHDPYSDDDYLLTVEQKVKEYDKNYFLARRGDKVVL